MDSEGQSFVSSSSYGASPQRRQRKTEEEQLEEYKLISLGVYIDYIKTEHQKILGMDVNGSDQMYQFWKNVISQYSTWVAKPVPNLTEILSDLPLIDTDLTLYIRDPWLPKDAHLRKLLSRPKYYEELRRLNDKEIQNLIDNYYHNGFKEKVDALNSRRQTKTNAKKGKAVSHLIPKNMATALLEKKQQPTFQTEAVSGDQSAPQTGTTGAGIFQTEQVSSDRSAPPSQKMLFQTENVSGDRSGAPSVFARAETLDDTNEQSGGMGAITGLMGNLVVDQIHLGDDFIAKWLQYHTSVTGKKLDLKEENIPQFVRFWHEQGKRPKSKYKKVYKMVDDDVLEGSLRAYMKAELDRTTTKKSKGPAKNLEAEISQEAAFSYLLKSMDFPSRLVLRILKMYLQSYKEYEIPDLINFYHDSYLQFIQKSDFQNGNKAFIKEFEAWYRTAGQNGLDDAVFEFQKLEAMVKRVQLLYKYKFTVEAVQGEQLWKFWEALPHAFKVRFGLALDPKEPLRDLMIETVFKKVKTKPEKKPVPKDWKFNEKLAEPKSRLAMLNNLKELGKKFPHDTVIKNMIREERNVAMPVKTTPSAVPKSAAASLVTGILAQQRAQSEGPEKTKWEIAQEKIKENQHKESLFKHFVTESVKADKSANKQVKTENKTLITQSREMYAHIKEVVLKYMRIHKQKLGVFSISIFLGTEYQELKEKFPEAVVQHFPYNSYGRANAPQSIMAQYPPSWKAYFLEVLKNSTKQSTKEGAKLKVIKKIPINVVQKFIDPSQPTKTMNTMFKNKVSKLDDHDAIRPWMRNDTYQAKKQIFMNTSDAKECRFTPKTNTGGKPGANGELDKWLERLGKNATGRNPMLFKTGVLQQAKLLFKQGQPIQAQQKLEDHFNVPSIMRHFAPERQAKKEADVANATGPVRERLVGAEHKTKPENFEDKKNLPVLEKVFRLLMKIETRKTKLGKDIQWLKREDTREHNPEKSMLCPLGMACPKRLLKGEKRCKLAHHPNQLDFSLAQRSKEAAKETLKKKLQGLMESDKPQPRWTGGNPIFPCNGCGDTFSVTPGERKGGNGGFKGQCSFCALQKQGTEVHKANLAKGREAKERRDKKFAESPKKQAEYKKRSVTEEAVTKKLGLYKLANVHYTKQQYGKALESINQAMNLVDAERQEEEQTKAKMTQQWSKKLNIDSGVTLSVNSFRAVSQKAEEEKFKKKAEQRESPGPAIAGLMNSIKQSTVPKENIQLFMQKTDNLEKGNSNKFLNIQIEELKAKIELEIKRKQRGIVNCAKTADKLNTSNISRIPPSSAGASIVEQKPSYLERPKKTQMCPKLADNSGYKPGKPKKKTDLLPRPFIPMKLRCTDPNCPYAHNPIELDLVPNEVMANNLSKQIKKKIQVDVDLNKATKPVSLMKGLVTTGNQATKSAGLLTGVVTTGMKNLTSSPKK